MRATAEETECRRWRGPALALALVMLAMAGTGTVRAAGLMNAVWAEAYDGEASGADQAVDMVAAPDGSIYVTGTSDDDVFNPDYLTLKYAPDGTLLWDNSFSGEGGDTPQAIAHDPLSGAVAVTGYSWVAVPEGHQVLTVVYEADGSTRWERYFNGSGDGNNSGYDVAFDGEGNVVAAGISYRNETDYDFITIKYSADGDVLWAEYYNGPPGFYDQVFALVIDDADRIYVTGRSAGGGGQGQDYCTICYEADGTEAWVSRYASQYGGDDMPRAIRLHPEGGVVVAGTSDGPASAGTDLAVVRYDADGNELWVKRYDSPFGGDDDCFDLAVTPDGRSFAVGRGTTLEGDTELLVFHVSPGGETVGAIRHDGPNGGDDCAYAAEDDGCGNVLVAGVEEAGYAGGLQNMVLLKVDRFGYQLWTASYTRPVTPPGRDEARAVTLVPGGVAAAGEGYGGDSGSDMLTVFFAPPPCLLLAAPGPGPGNPAAVRIYHPAATGEPLTDFAVFGVDDYGANVAAGDLDGDGDAEVLTGPGPGELFGPQVRAFEQCGAQMEAGRVNFMAYGTPRFGVNVSAGDLDGDGVDEMITGAGPGAVFGPHVRGFGYAHGSGVEPLPGVSFFAYGTPRFGVNVTAGDLDGDGVDEMITGAGPGAVFGPHVRAFSWDGASVTPLPGVSFFAYGTLKWGVNVAAGDIDGDGIDEILTGAGPGGVFGAHVRAFDHDGGTGVSPVPGASFFAFQTPRYGVRVSAGDLDGDGTDEILAVPGPGPAFGCLVRAFRLEGGTVQPVSSVDFFAFDPSTVLHGGSLAGAGPNLE